MTADESSKGEWWSAWPHLAFSIDISLHAHIFQFCCCCSYPFKASRLNFKRLSDKKKEFNCYMEALGPEFETWDLPYTIKIFLVLWFNVKPLQANLRTTKGSFTVNQFFQNSMDKAFFKTFQAASPNHRKRTYWSDTFLLLKSAWRFLGIVRKWSYSSRFATSTASTRYIYIYIYIHPCMLSYVMLGYVMLCYVITVMLCCAMSCDVTLNYAKLS